MSETRIPSGPEISPLSWRRSFAVLGAVLGVSALLVGVLALIVRFVPGVQPLALIAWTVPGHALAVLAAIAVLLRRWRVSFADLGFHRPTARLLHLVWQVPTMLVTIVLVQAAATAVLGAPPDRGDTVALLAGGAADLLPVAAVGIVVLVPIWEEAVFRGVVMGGLRRRLPVPAAVALSALLFAAAHAVPLLLPYLFSAGVCLALLARFHRTLWAPVIAHATLNALVLAVTITALRG